MAVETRSIDKITVSTASGTTETYAVYIDNSDYATVRDEIETDLGSISKCEKLGTVYVNI